MPYRQSHPLAMPYRQSHTLAMPYRQAHTLAMPYRQCHTLAMPYRQCHTLAMPYRQCHTLAMPYRQSHTLAMPYQATHKAHKGARRLYTHHTQGLAGKRGGELIREASPIKTTHLFLNISMWLFMSRRPLSIICKLKCWFWNKTPKSKDSAGAQNAHNPGRSTHSDCCAFAHKMVASARGIVV